MTKRPLSLTNRLMVFFLATLALVLGGFSFTLYALAHEYLHRRAAERLEAAVNTLAAAVEVTADGVEWEAKRRTVSVGEGPMDGQVDWLVSDDQGRVIDRSPGAANGGLIEEAARSLTNHPQPSKRFTWEGERWQIAQRWMRSDVLTAAPDLPPAEPQPDETKYPALAVTVGVPLTPVRAALRELGAGLILLSLVIWFAALISGRWVCRSALAPVTQVSKSAEAMGVADLRERLPRTGTGDELDGLIRSFNGLLDRLQESFDRQQRFTGDASHQLRTPLTAILGQIEVAQRRPRSPNEYELVLASVQRQAVHLRQIVESLLFLARANTDARMPGLEPLDLAEWLEQHLATWSDHRRASDLRPVNELSGPRWVSAHPVMLAELLNNLLDNATKYSAAGTPITVRVRQLENELALSVADRGCGVRKEELPHLFDPFYRSSESRHRGIAGVGLGLTVASRLATAMGARIEVSSEAAEGSCFTIRFPVAPCTEAAGQPAHI